MGLDEIRQEILEKANKEVARINKESFEKIKAIEREANERIETIRKERQAIFRKEILRMKQIQIAEAKSDALNCLLAKKQEIIDRVIRQARKTICQQGNDAKYAERMLAKANKEIEVRTVYCNKSVADTLRLPNTVIKEIDGIIAENNDATISVDYTIDSLLKVVKEKHIQQITKELFA